MPTITSLLKGATAQGLPRHEAHYLMLHACGRATHDRAWLLTHEADLLKDELVQRWQDAVMQRQSGVPVAYIVGSKEFHGLQLKISPAVLDPRDDTETLVDWALELIPLDEPFKVLDLGTGSGAVALAIRAQRPLAQVTATDASAQALAIAAANSAALELPVRFVQTNVRDPHWFSALEGQVFDLIVSNPPYIAQGDRHLAALKHEPAMALTSGKDGLDALRSIITNASSHLPSGGHLLLEHGYDQAERVCGLLSVNGFVDAITRHDLGGLDRCSGARIL
ncbi:MAG: peptide chain release factor N(5)-glutamine methyltransferase [Burkholderiales bacterium]|nr:MAG: peptide chain release factor N(5)-glutamine methyltransferase [Burkholderiales bacterium]